MCRCSVMVASSVLALVATLGCGASSQPITARPEAARAEQKASSSGHWAEARRSEANTESIQAKITVDEAHEAEHEGERSPAAVLKGLTQSGVVFMVEYSLTDAYQRAMESCNAIVGDDAGKQAECLGKAREGFAADVIRFREDDDGRLWWMIYRRKGEDLVEMHSVKVELDASVPGSVTMTTLGPGKGKRPLFKGVSRAVIGVPNEYSIEIVDPELGRLVYDAKVGLVR